MTAHAQDGDASQMSFSNLLVRANTVVERGQPVEAMPLLKELIQTFYATGTPNEGLRLSRSYAPARNPGASELARHKNRLSSFNKN